MYQIKKFEIKYIGNLNNRKNHLIYFKKEK